MRPSRAEGSSAVILGADHRPVEGNGGEVVGDVGHLTNIVFTRWAALAGFEVDGLNATAVGTKVGHTLLQLQVTGWIARTESEIARHR